MTVQTDVRQSIPLTAAGAFFKDLATTADLTRCRVKGVYIEANAAGAVIITDGNGGPQRIHLKTPAVANLGCVTVDIPGEGILFEVGPWCSTLGASTATLFYG